ncbi:hypothetical protein [Marinobacter sp. ELB17]|uniref:hypothetical protein n=1 Tax=Marinobacter sp. ELB17 TaxID=270374 RepID=UPI0000F38EAB|nr:hypothetical protein [Marinobacter sp. ELB17]EBA01017.1 3-ketoacyl-(acyl-carrier-protein) reductase [Marinobacter sp. ELB17]
MRSEPVPKILSIAWQDMCGPVLGFMQVLPTKSRRGSDWCRHYHRPRVGFILRPCVANPQPQEIIEIDSIRTLLARKLHHDYCHRRGKGAINFGQPAEQWLDNLTSAP